MASRFFFDKQDYELLYLVNRMLQQDAPEEQAFFSAHLHPHGVKELASSRELRIAYTVIHLLHSLEEGRASDRLHALQSLYDEVVSVAGSTFRYNTGRVLIQIMKDMVRAHGDVEQQLVLAHNFRKAARGTRRFVRKMLQHYHLLEMPEEWNQLTFDHHVHDSHTKGRKTPSRLIMDAWVKGIRSLTIIYYNYIELKYVQELFQAASTMGIRVQLGVDYRIPFRGKYVSLVWEPLLGDLHSLVGFLQEDAVKAFMQEGREASAYYARNVLNVLEQYNTVYKPAMEDYFSVTLQPISEEDFFAFVGAGQASLLHIADLIHRQLHARFTSAFPDLRTAYIQASREDEKQHIRAQVAKMQEMHPEKILQKWLIDSAIKRPVQTVGDEDDIPTLLRMAPKELVARLISLRRSSQITLTLANLSRADVLELLYDSAGKITHLELFNLKESAAEKNSQRAAINELQFAINQGSAIALKRIITDIIRECRDVSHPDAIERCSDLTRILYNIPQLQFFYRKKHIETRIGSDSTSRSNLLHGMGFVLTETLPAAAMKIANDPKRNDLRKILPIQAEVQAQYTYTPSKNAGILERCVNPVLRKIPGLHFVGYNKERNWQLRTESLRYAANADSIVTLGGFHNEPAALFTLEEAKEQKTTIKRGFDCLNTKLVNGLKVAIGFILAMLSFSFTQEWWLLAWFGAPIWFAITGIRNIIQAVLAGRDFRNVSLLHWRDYVNWSRICDSLLFTGISVPLLELILRWGILGQWCNMTSSNNPVLFFTIVSTVNGLYIASHNAYRGLQAEAIVGNLFRSVLAIPLALVYNSLLVQSVTALGLVTVLPVLADAAAIVSKTASDTVACIIEGFADRRTNMALRQWDYSHKLEQFLSCYSRLELLLPEQDVLTLVQKGSMFASEDANVNELEKRLLTHSLDLMYFLMYQPRARTMLAKYIQEMTAEEKTIFVRSQCLLKREKGVSQILVNGEIMHDFARVLSFYLTRYKDYLKVMEDMTQVPIKIV